MNLGINIDAYSSMKDNFAFTGEANTSPEALQDIAKALEAGSLSGQATMNRTDLSGSPLKTESLDSTLRVTTFQESEIVVWKRIPKSAAYSTNEEYNQMTDYGSDVGGFYGEGETPNEEDSTYVRRQQLVKFLGVKKGVTHVMTLTQTMIGNAIAQEAKNGTMWILRKLNRSIVDADSRIIPNAFNGVYAQHIRPDGSNFNGGLGEYDYLSSEIVVDLRGSYLKEEHMETAQEGMIENHGIGNEFFGAPKIFSDFAKGFYGKKYINPNTEQTSAGIMGQRVVGHDTQFGRVNFTPDLFMNKRKPKFYNDGGVGGSGAPNAIVPDGTTPINALTGITNSLWASSDAGNYVYGITAVNYLGESPMTVLSNTATTISAGGAVDLKFTASTSGPAATGFVIWRAEKGMAYNVAKFYKLFEVSAQELANGYNGAAASTVRDTNMYMPNTNQAFLIQNTSDVWTFRQLLPMMKMDLAITGPVFNFLVLLYGTPILFQQRKMVRFINVGLFIDN